FWFQIKPFCNRVADFAQGPGAIHQTPHGCCQRVEVVVLPLVGIKKDEFSVWSGDHGDGGHRCLSQRLSPLPIIITGLPYKMLNTFQPDFIPALCGVWSKNGGSLFKNRRQMRKTV